MTCFRAVRNQTTVFDQILALDVSLEEWLAGMACVGKLIYAKSPNLWTELDTTRRHLESHFTHLQYETELPYDCSARDALSILDDDTLRPITRILAQADQILGRKAMLRSFRDVPYQGPPN